MYIYTHRPIIYNCAYRPTLLTQCQCTVYLNVQLVCCYHSQCSEVLSRQIGCCTTYWTVIIGYQYSLISCALTNNQMYCGHLTRYDLYFMTEVYSMCVITRKNCQFMDKDKFVVYCLQWKFVTFLCAGWQWCYLIELVSFSCLYFFYYFCAGVLDHYQLKMHQCSKSQLV